MKRVVLIVILLLAGLASAHHPGILSLWEGSQLICTAFKADLNELGEALFGGDPIITAQHCVRAGTPLFASLDDGKTKFPVVRVWDSGIRSAKSRDFAYLLPDVARTEDDSIFSDYWAEESLPINTERLHTLDDVIVTGHPNGFELIHGKGYVARENTTREAEWNDLYVLDTVCWVGCSGGPVFNLDGEVVALFVGLFGPINFNGQPSPVWYYAIPTEFIFHEQHLH